MNVRPNETRVTATVRQVSARADGRGYDVDLEITDNQSPNPDEDFLQVKSGERIQVFSAAKGELTAGQQIRATLALSAGPFNQQTILRSSEAVKR